VSKPPAEKLTGPPVAIVKLLYYNLPKLFIKFSRLFFFNLIEKQGRTP